MQVWWPTWVGPDGTLRTSNLPMRGRTAETYEVNRSRVLYAFKALDRDGRLPVEAQAFLAQVPVFEQLLVDDGVLLFKYWLTVDQEQQEARFAERLDDPLKRWKLSPVDLDARPRYADYGRARERMLKATHTDKAPWTLVDFNDQRRGRLALIRHLLARVPDTHVPPAELALPPLSGAPLKESYRAGLKPI